MSPSGEPILSAGMTPGEAAKALLPLRLKHVWKCLERAVQPGHRSVEGVHRLRVASRRAVAALELFAPVCSTKIINRVEGMVRSMRRSADALRDMDVLVEKLNRLNPSVTRTLWRDLIAMERDSAVSSLVELHDRMGRKGRFSDIIKSLFKSIDKKKPDLYAEWACARIRRVVCKLVDLFPEQGADNQELHSFRIAVKKARYALEMAVDSRSERTILLCLLEKIQTRLGAMNDRFIAIDDLKRRCDARVMGPWRELLRREQSLARRARTTLNAWLISTRPLLERLVGQI